MSEELVKVYKPMILPSADYCNVVYHSLLTNELDEKLDRMQNHALHLWAQHWGLEITPTVRCHNTKAVKN